jgi:hypothetical protein
MIKFVKLLNDKVLLKCFINFGNKITKSRNIPIEICPSPISYNKTKKYLR